MAFISAARIAVAAIPFDRWRNSLGCSASSSSTDSLSTARRLASQVERAAVRLPFPTKCLPRAAALSWLLRRKGIGHTVVFAVRPEAMRDLPDPLHAWVEIDGAKLIGDLPGPWVETLRLGG
ncbi:MAG TPA: lasso peptide biosynthesis B2 protein [Sphingomicrobium sp.]